MLPILTCAISILLSTQATVGTITGCQGNVALVTATATFEVRPGGRFGCGEQLQTGRDGMATVLLGSDVVASLAPLSSLEVTSIRATTHDAGNDEARQVRALRVTSGEIRVVIGSPHVLSIQLGNATVTATQAIVRLASVAAGDFVRLEQGAATVRIGDRIQEIPAATTLSLTAPTTGFAWTIDARYLLLGRAAALAAQSNLVNNRSANHDPHAQNLPTVQTVQFAPSTPTENGLSPFQLPALPPSVNDTPSPNGTNRPVRDADADRVAQTPRGIEPGSTNLATRASSATRASVGRVRSTLSNVGSLNFNFGSFGGGSSFASASGGLFSDAVNNVVSFDGGGRYVHLVTAETGYTLDEVHLQTTDAFPTTREYWSIGLGTVPTTQVRDNPRTDLQPIFQTAPSPTTIPLPSSDAYLIRIDQIVQDPIFADVNGDLASVDNLKGVPPEFPVISGAEPLLDTSAEINDRLTFGLGEFVVSQNSAGHPIIGTRRSDQDRAVISDPNIPGSELEQLNSQVSFTPGINSNGNPDQLPTSFGPAPHYSQLGAVRKEAMTTLMADRLREYTRRTGQTRFVVDGKIVDISGYRGK